MIFLLLLLFVNQSPPEWSWSNADIGDYGYIEHRSFTNRNYEKHRWIKRSDGWRFNKIVEREVKKEGR